MIKLYLDLSNQTLEQKVSTMFSSSKEHLKILKLMTTVSQAHTQQSSKKTNFRFFE